MGGRERRGTGAWVWPGVLGAALLAAAWTVRSGCSAESPSVQKTPRRVDRKGTLSPEPPLGAFPGSRAESAPPAAIEPSGSESLKGSPPSSEVKEGKNPSSTSGPNSLTAVAEQAIKASYFRALEDRLKQRGLTLSESQRRALEGLMSDPVKYRHLWSRDPATWTTSESMQKAWRELEEEVRPVLTVDQASLLHQAESGKIGADWEACIRLVCNRVNRYFHTNQHQEVQIRAVLGSPPEVPAALLFAEAYAMTVHDLTALAKQRLATLFSREQVESLVPSLMKIGNSVAGRPPEKVESR